MSKVSSYLIIVETIGISKKLRSGGCLRSGFPPGWASKDWSQRKSILSYIEVGGWRNVSRIKISWAACLNLVNGIGRIMKMLSDLQCWSCVVEYMLQILWLVRATVQWDGHDDVMLSYWWSVYLWKLSMHKWILWSSGLGHSSGKWEVLGLTPTRGDFLFCLISVSKNLTIFIKKQNTWELKLFRWW